MLLDSFSQLHSAARGGPLSVWLCLERRFWVLCPKMTFPTCLSSLVPQNQELELFCPPVFPGA